MLWVFAGMLGLNADTIALAGSSGEPLDPQKHAVVSPALFSVPSGGFGIKVAGSEFTDLSGNVLQLQGENVSGLEGLSPDMWDGFYNTAVATWTSIKTAWGINIVRLPINEYDWRANSLSRRGHAYRTIIEATVANITASGLYVVIDLHWAAPNAYTSSACGSAPGCADGQPGYLNTDNSPGFWTSVAMTFKNNPAVLFELFNEPFADNASKWDSGRLDLLLNGGTFTFWDQVSGQGNPVNTGVSFQVAGHQQLVTAIRNTGATNVILYSCPVWDGAASQSLPVRPTDPLGQLAATVHYATGSNGDYSKILNANIPILITEYYSLASKGGYSWARSSHIGYVMWGANNWSSNPDLSLLIKNPPWSFNSQSVAWTQ
jgi:hypothetical protein